MFFVLFLLIGATLIWYGGWVLYIAVKTQGKITLRELAFEALLCAATATELNRIPEYSSEWRQKHHQ